MTKEEIVSKVKTLNLPENSYVVFGSCPMALAGLRESNDIDMLVSKTVFDMLKKSGWQEIEKDPEDTVLSYDVFEVKDKWSFRSYDPILEDLLSTATVVDGTPFASLEEVRKWKAGSTRPKDIA